MWSSTHQFAARAARVSLWARLCCPRAFWLGMLLGHAPAVWDAAGLNGGEFQLARLASLVASSALFLLKLADVPWLRLPRTFRARLVAGLCVVLLHADALRPGAAVVLDLAVEPVATVAAAAGAVMLLRAVLARLRSGGPRPLFPPTAWAIPIPAPLLRAELCHGSPGLRAPPACLSPR